MVTGNEYIFNNVDEALKYVLATEQRALAKDITRKTPPMVVRPFPGMFSQPYDDEMAKQVFVPVNSIQYPLSAWFNDASSNKFIITRLQSGRYSLKPNLRHRKFLFRGESEFHSPCKANLSRNPKQKRFTKELMKGQEMMLLMMSHPLVQLLDIGIDLCGKKYRFEMNLFGLTQHYYNKSTFLDLTSDPQVAAFFATTKYDWTSDTYSPVVEANDNIGVIYYYNLDINQDFVIRADGRKSSLSTIGLQVFPRSGRQKGFLYNLRTDQNFNQEAQVHAVRFYHKTDASKRIWKSFKKGNLLFPDDILMKHWRRYNAESNIISNRTTMLNKYHNPKMSLAEVEAEARMLGFEIKDYIPRFTEEELEEYYDAVLNDGYWQDFCNQIHIPGDKDGKIIQAMLHLPNDSRYHWAFKRNDSHVTKFEKGYVLSMYKECLK